MTGPTLLFVVTDAVTVGFLRGQAAHFRERGYHVVVASNQGKALQTLAESDLVTVVPVPMVREPSPLSDLRSLRLLHRLIRRSRPAAVHASTPKAGLLGMVAARAAGVPRRIYLVRGVRSETEQGLRLVALTAFERLSARLATDVFCVSESVRAEMIRRGLVAPRKPKVVGPGSSNGVDVERYRPPTELERLEARRSLGLDPDAFVIGFVGRLTRAKGVREALDAFRRLRDGHRRVALLVVGSPERGDPIGPDVLAALDADPDVVVTGFVDDPVPAYRAMDVLLMPTHREGFPNVPMEAAATGLPTVGFRVTGMVDAVVEHETGVLADLGDVEGLARALRRYAEDDGLRRAHGCAARERMCSHYRREQVWERYAEALGASPIATSSP